ncbi:hypothetical protein Vafri_16613 [Volvox africanus]|uniref:Uncharacterized protein n=1 Tax=Volvox africanus TaxID=51714 RepID=A0A8J4BIS4_9CHLO|nr:hypothetical protein Vafri_16613 [Volvox africanus]
MASDSDSAGLEELATRVKQLLWVVLDSVPSELVPWSLMLVRLLHAADNFPRGGLYDGHYAAQAALRYELFWLPLATRAQQQAQATQVLIPPLDVAVAWLLHRCTAPGSYPADCEALLGRVLDSPPSQAFRFAGAHAYSQCESPAERQAWASREVWDAVYATRGSGTTDTPYGTAASSPVPGSEVPSPRTDLGSHVELSPRSDGDGAGDNNSSAGGVEGTRRSSSSRRRFTLRRGSRGGSSAGSSEVQAAAQGDNKKLPAPAGAAVAYGKGGSRNGSHGGAVSSGSSRGGSSRLRAQFWPPAPPGSPWDLTRHCPLVATAPSGGSGGGGEYGDGGSGFNNVALLGGRGRLAGQLLPRMGELCPLLHSLLRPVYLDPDVLAQAVQRYCRFLMLQGMHPSVPMIPTTDIALMWVAHMAVHSAYRRTCHRLFGRLVLPAPGALRLEDSGLEFAETRRLYEHHFGEMYDPPLTRAVPLSIPHPLLSTPLAPFLSSFEVVPTGSSNLVLAATYFDADASSLPSPTTKQMHQMHHNMQNGTVEYGNGPASGGGGSGQLRCGAHALYLAYLLRRGGNRSTRSLIGMVLGQAHRRRAAVKYVANKAAGFRNFLHLPDSDCHVYWRKLRLRHVDPDSVPTGTATPSVGGSQPDESNPGVDLEDLYGEGGGGDSDVEADGDELVSHRLAEDQERQHDVVRQALALAQAAASAAAAAAGETAASGEGLPTPEGGSRRESSGGTATPLHSHLRPPPPQRQTRPSNTPGGGGADEARERPKRISLIVPLPPPSVYSATHSTLTFAATSSAPSGLSSERVTASGEPSAPLSDPPLFNFASVQQQFGGGSDGGGGGGSQSLTGYGIVARHDDAAAPAAMALPPQPPLPPSSASMAPTVDLAASLRAVAAAAKEPLRSQRAEPRNQLSNQEEQLYQEPPTPTATTSMAVAAATAAAVAATAAVAQVQGPEPSTPGSDITDSAVPSPPVRRPSIERQKYEDGTEGWAYNNPYYIDRLLELGPLSPLSPLGETPPPASAAILAARVGGPATTAAAAVPSAAAAGETAAQEQKAAPDNVTGADSTAKPRGAVAHGGSGGGRGHGFSGEKWAVRVAHPKDESGGGDGNGDDESGGGGDATIPTIAAEPGSKPDGDGGRTGGGDADADADAGISHNTGWGFEGGVWAVKVTHPIGDGKGGGGGGRLRQQSSATLVGDDGDGDGDGDGGLPAAPESMYHSCSGSREDVDVEDAGAAGGGDDEGAVKHRDNLDTGHKHSEEGEDVFCTPSAAFAAATLTPFSAGRPEKDDDVGGGGGDGGRDDAATASAFISGGGAVGGGSGSKLISGNAAAAAAALMGGGGGVGGGGVVRPSSSGLHPSRLARMTVASPREEEEAVAAHTPTASLSLLPAPAALTLSTPGMIRGGGGGGGSMTKPTTSNIRTSSLPPRPGPSTPRSGGSGSGGGGASTPKRASGAYSPADASYMVGFGGVASLVTRGEESPAFSKSLRERYGAVGSSSSYSNAAAGKGRTSAAEIAGGGGGGGGGGGSVSGTGMDRASSSAGFASPLVSSSGASFCSAMSRSSGGRGSGGAATGGGGGGAAATGGGAGAGRGGGGGGRVSGGGGRG